MRTARPLRVEFPGAYYHVINRGNFRFPIFEHGRDRQLLLDRLVEFAGQLGPISISGLTRARDLMQKRLEKDAKLRRRVTILTKRLAEKSNS